MLPIWVSLSLSISYKKSKLIPVLIQRKQQLLFLLPSSPCVLSRVSCSSCCICVCLFFFFTALEYMSVSLSPCFMLHSRTKLKKKNNIKCSLLLLAYFCYSLPDARSGSPFIIQNNSTSEAQNNEWSQCSRRRRGGGVGSGNNQRHCYRR